MRRRILACCTAVLTALATVALAPAVAHARPYQTTKGKSKPRYSKSVGEEYRVKTRWGTIYGIVERPVVPKGVKVPVILTYSPYTLLDGPTSDDNPPNEH